MIILEGPDGAGKTSLGKKLHEYLPDFPIYEIGPAPKMLMKVREYCMLCTTRANETCIQDRVTPISESIYSKVYARPSLPKGELSGWLDAILLKRPVIIYCRPAVFKHEPSAYDTLAYLEMLKKNHKAIVAAYDHLLWSSALRDHVITYDYSCTPVQELFHEHISPRLQRHR